jgi:MFS family permease
VFILPFVLARVFRPTYLAAFDLTNEQLGYCFSIFGFVAIGAYLLGGFLADKIQAKNLITSSLILTALGGFYMSTLPNFQGMLLLFGYWGFTTIFLLWAAMIKATRVWGGQLKQGRAFGFLDGGRGLVAFVISIAAIALFSLNVDLVAGEIALADKKDALTKVIFMSSCFVLSIGVLVFIFFEKINSDESEKVKINELFQAFKIPQVYLLSGMVFCAYSAYRLTDIIPQFAHEVGGMDEIFSSKISTIMLFLRAAVGFSIGFLADKGNSFNYLKYGFIAIALACVLFLFAGDSSSNLFIFALPSLIIALGTYACRVLYFAVVSNSNIPLKITGSAVGVISVIGYLPDIYFGVLAGYFLDEFGYDKGFQYTFILIFILSLIGLFLAHRLKRIAVYE